MPRQPVRGVGSNQYRDQPAACPPEPTSVASVSGSTVLDDPFADDPTLGWDGTRWATRDGAAGQCQAASGSLASWLCEQGHDATQVRFRGALDTYPDAHEQWRDLEQRAADIGRDDPRGDWVHYVVHDRTTDTWLDPTARQFEPDGPAVAEFDPTRWTDEEHYREVPGMFATWHTPETLAVVDRLGGTTNPLLCDDPDTVDAYDEVSATYVETVGWHTDETTTLPARALTANQHDVDPEKVARMVSDPPDDPVMVVDDGDTLWVWDGNRRAVAALLADRQVTVEVMKVDALYETL